MAGAEINPRKVKTFLNDLNLADRVALVVAGQIQAMGAPHQVLKPELISEAYCWPVQVVEHPLTGEPLVLPE